MKVLLPYQNHSIRKYRIQDGTVVLGGVEKFLYDCSKHSSYSTKIIEYLEYSPIVEKALLDADLIIINRFNARLINFCIKNNKKFNIILHASAGSIGSVHESKRLLELNDIGIIPGTVSEFCRDSWRDIAKRRYQLDLQISDEFINPTFALKLKPEPQKLHSMVTVGRACDTKNPFLLSKIANIVDCINYKIFTTFNSSSKTDKNEEYYSANKDEDKYIGLDIPHTDIMTAVSKSTMYLSTCLCETFGISAFEALNRGVPIIYFKTKAQVHHGHDVFATHLNSVCTEKNNKEELIAAFERFYYYGENERRLIQEDIYKRFNIDVFRDKLDNFITKSLKADINFSDTSSTDIDSLF